MFSNTLKGNVVGKCGQRQLKREKDQRQRTRTRMKGEQRRGEPVQAPQVHKKNKTHKGSTWAEEKLCFMSAEA